MQSGSEGGDGALGCEDETAVGEGWRGGEEDEEGGEVVGVLQDGDVVGGVGVGGVLLRRWRGNSGGEGGGEIAGVGVCGCGGSFQEENWDRRGGHGGAISCIVRETLEPGGGWGSDVWGGGGPVVGLIYRF